MFYNLDVKTFSEWLTDKFEAWNEREGGDKGAFAKWLGVPSTTLSNWMNGGFKPRGDNLGRLSFKLGIEVYEVLGMTPPEFPPDEQLRPIAELILQLPEEDRQQARDAIEVMLRKLVAKVVMRRLENEARASKEEP